MGLLDEFKSFISNGNVLDLTVGVITGAAFSKVVSSFTDDIIMPSAALLKSSLQRVPGASAINPDALAAAAKLAPPTATVADSGAAHVAHAAVAAAADSGATAAHVAAAATDTAAAAHAAVAAAPATFGEGLATIGIGNFISSIVYFLIISVVILLVTKVANRFRRPAEVEVVNEHDLEPVLSREEALLIEIRDALLRSREQQ